MPTARWQAHITYRFEHGTVDYTRDLEELADLHDLVERGPHWDTVVRIEITRVKHTTDPLLTTERAAAL